jgi:phospholipase/carboxylesterase
MQAEKYDHPHIIEPNLPATAAVIWLHGLGADGFDFATLAPQLNFTQKDQTRFVFPHAPVRPVTINGNMPCRAWYDILSLSKLDQEDHKGIEMAEQSLLQLIDEQRTYGIHANRIILAGFSQGAAIALYTGLRYQQALAGILALSSYLPLSDTFNSENFPNNRNTPILQIHGEQDTVLPIQLAERTVNQLKEQGHPIEWQMYPMAHEVCLEEIHLISHWLNKVLSD